MREKSSGKSFPSVSIFKQQEKRHKGERVRQGVTSPVASIFHTEHITAYALPCIETVRKKWITAGGCRFGQPYVRYYYTTTLLTQFLEMDDNVTMTLVRIRQYPKTQEKSG